METFNRIVTLARDRQTEARERAAVYRQRREVRQRAREQPLALPEGRREPPRARPPHPWRIPLWLRARWATAAPRSGKPGLDA